MTAGEFVFKGDEMLVYNAEPLANLKFQARYMLSLQKVEGRYETDSALEPFGLDAAASPVTVTVTNSNGAAHTVLFGDKLVTGAAYYAKDAAKPFVYVVDSSVSVFFEDEKSFFDPKIAPTLTQSEYQYMESFAIRKNGEPFLASAIVPEEQRTDTGDTDLHKITYPAGYSASLSKYYEALASLATLSGSKVIETNVFASGEENTAALFDKYGLTVATNDVSYAVGEKSYRFLTGTRFTDSDGKYDHPQKIGELSPDDGWKTFKFTFEIPDGVEYHDNDEFSFYVNPADNSGVNYLFDNVTVTVK